MYDFEAGPSPYCFFFSKKKKTRIHVKPTTILVKEWWVGVVFFFGSGLKFNSRSGGYELRSIKCELVTLPAIIDSAGIAHNFVEDLVGELLHARDLLCKEKLTIALPQHLPLPFPSDTVGDDVAMVPLSIGLPDFNIDGKVCKSKKLLFKGS